MLNLASMLIYSSLQPAGCLHLKILGRVIMKMKSWFRKISSLCLLIVVVISSITAFASSPNYATSVEGPWPGLYYDGYIQIQPSYNDGGYHAARGYYVYRNGRDGEVWTYTEYGRNQEDSRIYSASSRYYDSLNPFAPEVTWNYNFEWVPHGSGIWPVSIPNINE